MSIYEWINLIILMLGFSALFIGLYTASNWGFLGFKFDRNDYPIIQYLTGVSLMSLSFISQFFVWVCGLFVA